MIWPSAPPPPVTSMMMPAEAMPFSISLRAVFLSRRLPRVKMASTSPRPTAMMGWPRKIRTLMKPVFIFSALATVLIRMSTMGRSSGPKDSKVPGTPSISMLNAPS